MRTVAYLSKDTVDWLILSARKDPKSLIGESYEFADKKEAREALMALSVAGYSAHMSNTKVIITDYLPPATSDSEGFFIENDALAMRIRRGFRQEPYCDDPYRQEEEKQTDGRAIDSILRYH